MASLKKSLHFSPRGHFFALQMVKLSSLHDDQWPDEALHHYHSIDLVIALQMGQSLSFPDILEEEMCDVAWRDGFVKGYVICYHHRW